LSTWKKVVIGVLILAVVGSGLYFYFRPRENSSSKFITAKVQRGDIERTLSFSGNTELLNEVNVTPRIGGRVAQIYVKVGDHVEKDEDLLKIDVPDLDNQIAQARINLENAKLKLDQLQEGPSQEELRTLQLSIERAKLDLKRAEDNLASTQRNVTLTSSLAEDTVASAQRRLEEAQKNLSLIKDSASLSVEIAQTQLNQAQDDLDNADNSAIYETLKRNVEAAEQRIDQAKTQASQQIFTAESQVTAAEDALRQAKLSLEQRKQQNEDLLREAQAGLQAAQLALESAQAQLDLRTAPVSSTSLSMQEKMIEQARLTLDNLLEQQESTILRAPVSGTVISISPQVGDFVTSNVRLITIANTQAMEIKAFVPEVNIGFLSAKMSAKVKSDAFPDQTFKASLQAIDPVPTILQGVVNYTAHFLIEGENPLKPGLTVDLELTVAQSKNTLLVPRSALRKEGNTYYVSVLRNDKVEDIPVTVGVMNELQAEIKEGLSEGEEVIIATSPASFQFPTNLTPSPLAP